MEDAAHDTDVSDADVMDVDIDEGRARSSRNDLKRPRSLGVPSPDVKRKRRRKE
jgi:hypothetical protein